jgi:hypothetical protein
MEFDEYEEAEYCAPRTRPREWLGLSATSDARVWADRSRAARTCSYCTRLLMRPAADHLFREGQLLAWGVPATGVLVETLLDRAAQSDVVEAETAVDR